MTLKIPAIPSGRELPVLGSKRMTTCNAVVCDDGSAVVLVADKMIGMGYVESELEITKMRPIHKEWWVLFAGDDITPVFDIVDYAKARLNQKEPASVGEAQDAVKAAFAQKRMEMAEALFLGPIGWDIVRFNDEGNNRLPDFTELKAKISDYTLGIELLVAGFDGGKGHVFTLHGYGENRGIPQRSDVPGFASIGSGSIASMYMMFYRDLGPKTGVREAVYYALEGKYFGEQASGVGASTDLFVARPEKGLIQISDEDTVEKKLIPVCYRLSPNLMQKRDREVLNNLKELKDFPKIKEPARRAKPKPQKSLKAPPPSLQPSKGTKVGP
jgi:20S proteasome alpha/beta subunit